MQLISKDREERVAFYADHNIGWVARPGHSSAAGGFKRAGKFKKTSSMNYGLAISLKLENFLNQLIAEGAEDTAEECLEDRAMYMAQEEIFEETGRQFKPCCANGKSLRMREIILIIDSDTVVPKSIHIDFSKKGSFRAKDSIFVVKVFIPNIAQMLFFQIVCVGPIQGFDIGLEFDNAGPSTFGFGAVFSFVVP